MGAAICGGLGARISRRLVTAIELDLFGRLYKEVSISLPVGPENRSLLILLHISG